MLFCNFMQNYEIATGQEVLFSQWVRWGMPVVILMLPVAFFWISRGLTHNQPMQLPATGPWRKEEKRVLIVFAITALAWMTAAVIAGTTALLTAGLKYLNVRTFVRLLAGFAAFFVGTVHWHTRPHIFTTFIFTYFVLALVFYYQTERWKVLIPLPIVMIFWANLHGLAMLQQTAFCQNEHYDVDSIHRWAFELFGKGLKTV